MVGVAVRPSHARLVAAPEKLGSGWLAGLGDLRAAAARPPVVGLDAGICRAWASRGLPPGLCPLARDRVPARPRSLLCAPAFQSAFGVVVESRAGLSLRPSGPAGPSGHPLSPPRRAPADGDRAAPVRRMFRGAGPALLSRRLDCALLGRTGIADLCRRRRGSYECPAAPAGAGCRCRRPAPSCRPQHRRCRRGRPRSPALLARLWL